ncbi:nucleoside triphosphate pyrophosphohydrolase [candidate division KSB3 bacterium]|uniref:Nucleoside triphosphate pyrophosphohydrolase n=1 Tax=candidate division KSB3 bacterium TaxID=2044937 RepID=A0A2G6EEA4_9BACT|nr:MAG: nucleoside triphosphate pyrophosphohydrolase [candidate division KSB3 bacterium]PIE28389.1 MAG: nucleoside triphosphate pyrophosphohydrolase [candidate division KSB3 bacterium]
MSTSQAQSKTTLEDLIELMATLRSEKGCPWDRKQTKASIKPYILEESYEVVDAVEKNDSQKIKEELGDVLFQVVFYAQLLKEEDQLDIYDILESVHRKMVRRHPHVFGGVELTDASEVPEIWERMKHMEKTERNSVLDDVPNDLPSLMKAQHIQSKASHAGVEWDNYQQALDKLDEEFSELRQAYEHGKPEMIEDEFGDLLFTLVSIARFLNVNPDNALRRANAKFTKRVTTIEKHLQSMQKEWKDMSPEEIARMWDAAKSETQ